MAGVQGLPARADIAIVGGGVAGFYLAWRLLQDDHSRSVVVLEGAHRIGGRLYSQRAPGYSSVCVEHGGMRFSHQHRLLTALVDFLRLPTAPYNSVLNGHNPIFLRGQRTSMVDLDNGGDVPYRLPAWMTSHQPGEVIPQAVMSHLQHHQIDLREAGSLLNGLSMIQYHGKPFDQISFLELLECICDSEMLAYYNDVHGYWVDTHKDVSAFELLQGFLPFVSDSNTVTLKDGMQSLPCTLAEQSEALGCSVGMGARVAQITKQDDVMVLAGQHDGAPFQLQARDVILTLPPNQLRRLDGLLTLAPSLDTYLSDAVVEIPAIKTHFSYANAWWSSSSIDQGEARTDLPMRQCLYMGSDAQRDGVDASSDAGPALLLASYTDSDASDYWRSFAGADRDPDDLDGPEDITLRCGHAHRLALMDQLNQLHGRELPGPLWVSSCDWLRQPSGVATHSWRAGINSTRELPRIRHPQADLSLHLCGEAFSQEQGWVNGALRSAEAVLQSKFALERPSWCPSDAPIDPL